MANVAPPPRLFSVGYISPKDEPIFVQAFSFTRNPSRSPDDLLKANYVANCALDVFDERGAPAFELRQRPVQCPILN
jgi:hypothetical protein